MKRALALIALFAASAGADTLRKPVPAKFKKAAGELFRQAVDADDRGRASEAIDLYKRAYAIAPHANIVYNMAELQDRLGWVRDAVYSYELYLALSPRSSEEKKLRAKIVEIESRPTTLEITTGDSRFDFAAAYILIDGELVHKPKTPGPFKYKVGPGVHLVDVITPVTSASRYVEVTFGGGDLPVSLQFPPVVDANVFFSVLGMTLNLDGKTIQPYEPGQRLAPGKYRAAVEDRNHECPPIAIDAPKGDDVLNYVHVHFVELQALPNPGTRPARCRKLVVKEQKLVF